MKKLSLFVAPIMAASFLIGCGGGGESSEKAKFFIDEQAITIDDSGMVATVPIDWTPSSNAVKISELSYEAKSMGVESCTPISEEGTRPYEVDITFTSEITTNVEGALSFHYKDTTAKADGYDSITFTIPAPDPHKVNAEEFVSALSFTGVEYLQVDETNDGFATDYELCPTVCHSITNDSSETFISKQTAPEQYNKYYRDTLDGGYIYMEDVSYVQFLDPHSPQVEAIQLLPNDSYKELNNYNYDSTSHEYKDNIDDYYSVTLKFYDKKLMSMDIDDSTPMFENSRLLEYDYEENIPALPQESQKVNPSNVELPDVSSTPNIAIDSGKIYIKISNANVLGQGDQLTVSCHLPNEDFIYEVDEAFALVTWYYANGETSDTGSISDEDNKKQLWDYNVQGSVGNEFYVIITLNDEFSSAKSGNIVDDLSKNITCDVSKDSQHYMIDFEIADFVSQE